MYVAYKSVRFFRILKANGKFSEVELLDSSSSCKKENSKNLKIHGPA